ncbi:hypothetical protein Tco_0054237 [Tanacetum coccineum]
MGIRRGKWGMYFALAQDRMDLLGDNVEWKDNGNGGRGSLRKGGWTRGKERIGRGCLAMLKDFMEDRGIMTVVAMKRMN